jgi:hypothetical protein
MEKNNLEQLYAIKFCIKLGKGAIDTYIKFQKTSDNDSPSRAQVFRWYKYVENGSEKEEDKP